MKHLATLLTCGWLLWGHSLQMTCQPSGACYAHGQPVVWTIREALETRTDCQTAQQQREAQELEREQQHEGRLRSGQERPGDVIYVYERYRCLPSDVRPEGLP
jgi:hypothetical protein